MDWGWFPFLYLRPEKNVPISFGRFCKTVAYFSLIFAPLFGLLVGGRSIGAFLSAMLMFLVLYSVMMAFLHVLPWNVRADHLLGKPEATRGALADWFAAPFLAIFGLCTQALYLANDMRSAALLFCMATPLALIALGIFFVFDRRYWLATTVCFAFSPGSLALGLHLIPKLDPVKHYLIAST